MSGVDEVKLYILINSSLKMGKGKMIAQACHGIQMYLMDNPDSFWYVMPKIVLKCPEDEMMRLQKEFPGKTYLVQDEGRTQIPAGSYTCLIFLPNDTNEVPDIISKLKLL
jgi:PTH2 family peptidyl-tRNA hydrolase